MVRLQIPINERVCVKCGATTTYINTNGRQQWGNVNGECYCSRCWDKQRLWKKLPSKRIKGKKRLTFQRKRIQLQENPRKGKCKVCGKKVGDEYVNYRGQVKRIKRTHLHHYFYVSIMPWACTIELCVPCHSRESWKAGTIGLKRREIN